MSFRKRVRTEKSALQEFCENTSLHGYTFLFHENKSGWHTLGWIIVILASFLVGGMMIGMNIMEFMRATVSFNLESPTTPLSEVFFPSIVVCNLNSMRKSFVHSLLRDPEMGKKINEVHADTLLVPIFIVIDQQATSVTTTFRLYY